MTKDGPLPSNRLAWFSDQVGSLGIGEAVTVSLPVGIHVLTLVANDSAFLTTSTSITVEVLADFDGDGLADAYEEQYGELAWWNAEDAGAELVDRVVGRGAIQPMNHQPRARGASMAISGFERCSSANLMNDMKPLWYLESVPSVESWETRFSRAWP